MAKPIPAAPAFVVAPMLLLAALCLCGCPKSAGVVGAGTAAASRLRSVQVAPGVVYERDDVSGVSLLDVNLETANVRPVVVAANIERLRNNFVGDARTVSSWCAERSAVAGINGGFFGETYPEKNGVERKQIVGLTVVDGQVITPGSRVKSTRTLGERYTRAAVGFGKIAGTPDIAFATATRYAGVRRYATATDAGKGVPWAVRFAVACGPRLFVRGNRKITDVAERLVSPGRLTRSFVAYDTAGGKPRHLILGCADAMTFDQVADYLAEAFARRHTSHPHDAMCLDGGASSQIAYREPNGRTFHQATANDTTVPNAILLVPNDRSATDTTPSNSEGDDGSR